MLSFGKHKGKTFDEVAASDAGYCRWVLNIEAPTGGLAEFQGFLKGRTPGASAGGDHAAPSGARASVPAPAAVPVAPAQVPGAALLESNTIFVLELVSPHRFELRAERLDPEANSSTGLVAWLPKPVWQEISSWPGQEPSADRKSWTFPLGCHGDVVNKLRVRAWPVDPVPDFALRTVAANRDVPRPDVHGTELPSMLMPYQRAGVLFGLNQAKGRVLIGDEMGLGKTLQALVLVSLYREDWPVLVICPSSLRYVWKEQAERWLPHLCDADRVQVITTGKQSLQPDARIWVVSYNLLADSRTAGKFSRRPGGAEPHQVVICDESHHIKEWKAQRTKAVVQVLRDARRAVLLSGTPTRSSPDELHPQLCGLEMPGLPKYQAFRRRYCLEKQCRVGGGQAIARVVGARNSHELNLVLTTSVMIRRLKKDVLHELPEKRRQKVPIEPSNSKAISQIRRQMASMTDEGSAGISTLFQKLAVAKLPDVKEYVLDVLDRGDEKFIVFAHHREMLDGIEEALKARLAKDGLSHVRIDGSTPAEKRLGLVNRFQEEERCRVAILSITACCEGLTMTAAGLVIFAELYWVPGVVEQAEARAHRIGTKHTKVVVEFLVVSGSPDEMIFAKLERKKRDTSSVLDGLEGTFEAESCSSRPLKPLKRPADSQPAADASLSPIVGSIDRFLRQRLDATSPQSGGDPTPPRESGAG